MFKALSNPQRLRIFIKFCKCCEPRSCGTTDDEVEGCVASLSDDLGLAASTVSHHLKELRQAGLLKVERRGKRIECWIGEDVLQLLATFFSGAREESAG